MLKALMLRKKIDDANKALATLRETESALQTREAELENDIAEASSDEERAVVEEAIGQFESDKAENEKAIDELTRGISEMESELAEIEAHQESTPATEEAPTAPTEDNNTRDTKEVTVMAVRGFKAMTIEQRTAFCEREDVKSFIERAREMMQNKRSVTGAGYLIPEVVLDLIRENILEYSKLINRVRLVRVNGTARQPIMGVIPEAVWTEMCANINELDFSFTKVEVDGYKVGGYVAVCNASIEDSDINLLNELITGIGQAIGLALDKAIIYGTGTKMPTGIFTTINDGGTLASSQITTISAANSVGTALFKNIILAAGKAKGKYSRGDKFWAMNEKTYNNILAESVSINAAGAIAAGVGGTMPVIGGDIVVLDFIKDDNIIGGYGDLYLLAERAGTEIATSEHVRFLADETVIKGTARYDGAAVIPTGFVAIGINNTTPASTGITFASDSANP